MPQCFEHQPGSMPTRSLGKQYDIDLTPLGDFIYVPTSAAEAINLVAQGGLFDGYEGSPAYGELVADEARACYPKLFEPEVAPPTELPQKAGHLVLVDLKGKVG